VQGGLLSDKSTWRAGWSVYTRPRVCLANVVVEMIPVLQMMVRQTRVCVPYVLHVEYCTARRPATTLRGKRSDYTNSFKAVALAVRRAFPFVIVRGNPMAPAEKPRIGSFEISFVDPERGSSQVSSSCRGVVVVVVVVVVMVVVMVGVVVVVVVVSVVTYLI